MLESVWIAPLALTVVTLVVVKIFCGLSPKAEPLTESRSQPHQLHPGIDEEHIPGHAAREIAGQK